jgi:hypothetical protein
VIIPQKGGTCSCVNTNIESIRPAASIVFVQGAVQ